MSSISPRSEKGSVAEAHSSPYFVAVINIGSGHLTMKGLVIRQCVLFCALFQFP